MVELKQGLKADYFPFLKNLRVGQKPDRAPQWGNTGQLEDPTAENKNHTGPFFSHLWGQKQPSVEWPAL